MFYMKPHDLDGILLERLDKNLHGNGSSRDNLQFKCLQCNKQTNKYINGSQEKSKSSGDPTKEKEATVFIRGDDFYDC